MRIHANIKVAMLPHLADRIFGDEEVDGTRMGTGLVFARPPAPFPLSPLPLSESTCGISIDDCRCLLASRSRLEVAVFVGVEGSGVCDSDDFDSEGSEGDARDAGGEASG